MQFSKSYDARNPNHEHAFYNMNLSVQDFPTMLESKHPHNHLQMWLLEMILPRQIWPF